MHWPLLTVILFAAPAPAEKKKDEEKFQGTWTVVSMEYGGQKTPDDEIKAVTLIIKDDLITIDKGKTDERMTFKLDPAKKPKTIDLLVKREVGKDLPVPGIYEVKDDELRICFAKAGEGERPTEFVSKAGTSHALLILKREKPKKDEEKIQGTWTVVFREFVGRKTPEAELKAWPKWIIKDGTITADDGKKKEVIPYKLDPSKKPKAIDLTMELPVDGKGKKAYPYIYELDGDTLKLCWSEKAPDHRPTE